MIELLRHAAEAHVALWVVPALVGALLAALGSRLGRRWMAVLALVGVAIPLLQAVAAAVFLLWVSVSGTTPTLRFTWMTGGVSVLHFALDRTGVWAVLVSSTAALVAQGVALAAVARFAGRHRYHALVLMLVASANVLFTSGISGAGALLGWEGLALCGSLLVGFWGVEERGTRTGLRWLLFQRLSGVLLLLGFAAFELDSGVSAALVLAAACLRAGQFPFHAWWPDTSGGRASAGALVNGVASCLAAVYLVERTYDWLVSNLPVPELFGSIGAASVILGLLAAIQQRHPQKTVGWLFLVHTGFCWLAFSVFEPVAASLIATASVLGIGGIALASGAAVTGLQNDPFAPPASRRASLALVLLSAATLLPPGLMFAGISRLLVAVPEDASGWGIRIGVWLAGFGVGWVLLRLWRGASTLKDPEVRSTAWTLEVLPMGLAAVCLLLGIVGLPLHGIEFWGGSVGIPGGGGFALAGILGWLASALAARRARRPAGRWTSTDWALMHAAETGLGIGELVVQLPLMLVRALGVVVWRVVGDWIVDGLVLGLAVRAVEGVGLSLRYLQNGRVQRYLWVALTAALMLVWMLVRE